jgi:hypothetical protein
MKIHEPPDDESEDGNELDDAGFVFLPRGDEYRAEKPEAERIVIQGPSLGDLVGMASLMIAGVTASVSIVAALLGIAWRVFTFIAGIK